jgi:hypothetical protein
MSTRGPSRGEQAIDAFRRAQRLDAKRRVQFGDDVVFDLEANAAREKAAELLKPDGILVEGGGEAVAWQPGATDRTAENFVSTLESPSSVSVGASERRLRALSDLGITEAALDTAHTVRAANAIEKMLAHQLTAAHFQSLRFLELSAKEGLEPADAVRYASAAVRMMEAYQSGCLALQKLKTKGQQRVVVQHVDVRDGGRAVVAGTISPGLRRSKRGKSRK